MKHLVHLISGMALAILALCLPESSFAAQFSCNGRIQYRPCGQPMHTYKRPVQSPAYERARSKNPSADSSLSPEDKTPETVGEPFAKVTQHTFRSLPKGEGIWHGTVSGNGTVHLKLNLLRDGEVEDTRYMGRIYLKNKSTWFSFKSLVPKWQNWTWNITAFAE